MERENTPKTTRKGPSNMDEIIANDVNLDVEGGKDKQLEFPIIWSNGMAIVRLK